VLPNTLDTECLSNIARTQTPEERELAAKTAELAVLETQLAQRELDIATFRVELHAFERRYLRIVGVKFVEIDVLEAQIAEALNRRDPSDETSRPRAEQARSKATPSACCCSFATRKSSEPWQGPHYVPRSRHHDRRCVSILGLEIKKWLRRTVGGLFLGSPSAADIQCPRAVKQRYRAEAIVLFAWKKGVRFSPLEVGSRRGMDSLVGKGDSWMTPPRRPPEVLGLWMPLP
jgi:hypothetical protein